jgi:hypothetical protein
MTLKRGDVQRLLDELKLHCQIKKVKSKDIKQIFFPRYDDSATLSFSDIELRLKKEFDWNPKDRQLLSKYLLKNKITKCQKEDSTVAEVMSRLEKKIGNYDVFNDENEKGAKKAFRKVKEQLNS